MVEDGIIKEICDTIDDQSDEIIDAQGLWVTPGLIDVHVHLREPGYEYKETIASGSRAAAKGGFTTICCMPNTNPVVDNEVLVEYIKMKAEREAVVNVLPIGSITKSQQGEVLSNIGKMAKAGICAISEDGKSVKNAGLLKKAMKYASMYNIPVFSHCEDMSLVGNGVMNSGEMAERVGMKGISSDSEEVIVARDIILARSTEVRLHICHISTKGSVQLVREAKMRGENISAEVCPHHFSLTDEVVEGYDANTKMNPPLRMLKDLESLKEGLKDHTIEIIATDHAPHHEDEKNCEYDRAAFGIVGLETALSLGITNLVEENVLTPLELIEKMSTNPAKLLRIDKGCLEIGKVADITIINPNEEYEVDVNTFASKSKNTPFNGSKVKGRVRYTIVSGKIVVNNGELIH